jgi:hypothetical protein
LLAALFLSVLKKGGLPMVLSVVTMRLMLLLGFDLKRLPNKMVLLGFVTTCDPYNFDAEITRNCGKGELSMDQGEQDSGGLANISRERMLLDLKNSDA